jgi:hypothetical protein
MKPACDLERDTSDPIKFDDGTIGTGYYEAEKEYPRYFEHITKNGKTVAWFEFVD